MTFVRIGWLAIDLVVAPHQQRLRLVEMGTPAARRCARVLLALVILAAVAALIPDFLIEAMQAANLATSLQFAAATLSVPLVIAVVAREPKTTVRKQGRFSRFRLPQFPVWFLRARSVPASILPG